MSNLIIFNTEKTSSPSKNSKEKETYEYFSTPVNDLPVYVAPSDSTVRTYDESPRCHGYSSPHVDTNDDNTEEHSRSEGRRRTKDGNRRKRRLGEGGKDLKDRRKGHKKSRSTLKAKVSDEESVEEEDSGRRRVRYREGNEEISGRGVKGNVRHSNLKRVLYNEEPIAHNEERQSNLMTEVNDDIIGLSPPVYDEYDYENDFEVTNGDTAFRSTPPTHEADIRRRKHREAAIPSTHPGEGHSRVYNHTSANPPQDGHSTPHPNGGFQEHKWYPPPSPSKQVRARRRLPYPASEPEVVPTEKVVLADITTADMAHFISKSQADFTSWVFNETGDSSLVHRALFFVFTLFVYFSAIYVFLTLLATFFHKQIQFTPFDWNAVGIN